MRAALAGIAVLLLLAAGPAAGESPGAVPAGRDFGAGLTLERTTALSELVRSPERFAGEPVLLRGRISDVCQRKGCWTVLSEGGASVRVHFLDYGFFLPKDAIGAEAYVEGLVEVATLSEAEARHYESESRSGDPDAVDGPRRELRFRASGVRLVDAD